MRRLLLILLVPILISCGPAANIYVSSRYEPTPYDYDVVVYELSEKVPDSARKVGEIHVGDSGVSTRCSYNDVKQELLLETRKVGGHAVKIYEHKLPNFWSTCHSIKAYVYRVGEELEPNQEID